VTYNARGAMQPWQTKVTASEVRVFVEAAEAGPMSVTENQAQYDIVGLKGKDANNTYGLSEKITLEKQDYQGIRAAYEFDPKAERYISVDPMEKARWYPTLVGLDDGRVLAVSGLDDVGVIDQGDNEIYDPKTKKWTPGPKRYFPTYPALFLTKGGKLFYPASNAGYGPANKGREPGLWDLKTNKFTKVAGLRDPEETETSSSLLLPPAQDQKVMILGGGGVGESKKSTPRTAVVDLKQDSPVFKDGPDLPQGTRYLNSVIMPDDSVFTTNGSSDYRGRSASNIHKAQFYDPKGNAFREAAAPMVGRNYHSEALLLPDGRVVTFGSDPLFDDQANTKLGHFEQRMEIFTPPALHKNGTNRPVLQDGPETLDRHHRATFRTDHPDRVVKARLMRPSSVTHTTDVEQRSIELGHRQGRQVGDGGRTERPGAGAARLVHALRDGRPGHAVGGQVDPGAAQSCLRSHRPRRRALEAALGIRAVHGRDHFHHARAPDPARRGRRGRQAVRADVRAVRGPGAAHLLQSR
jgi:hypothetical protein